MSEMTTSFGAFNADTRQVTATFTMNGVTHTRNVNAVLSSTGKYNRAATAERVAEVANGVAVKIAAGVITNPPVEEAPEGTPAT